MGKSLVRQDEEWQTIQKKRSNDPDNEAADSALIDEQKILEQQKFQEVRDMFKAQVIKIPRTMLLTENSTSFTTTKVLKMRISFLQILDCITMKK